MPLVHEGKAIDLNLVRVLDALLEEQHLTRAGQRLGMTQSATSKALARLRRIYDDPLFLRTPHGLAPTARADALAGPVREESARWKRCFGAEEVFVPSRAERRFDIATSDYGSFVLSRRLLETMSREAPGVDLTLRALESPFAEQLARGAADVVVMPTQSGSLPASIRSRPLGRERLVCLVRRGHPLARKRLDLATWTRMRHILVAPRGNPGSVVEDALVRLGTRRRVALTMPHFLLAPHVVASSDLVVTVGARVAEAFVDILPLRIVEPPIELKPFELRMYWHESQHRSPPQQWIRDAVRGAFTS